MVVVLIFILKYVINEASCKFSLFGTVNVAQLVESSPNRHRALVWILNTIETEYGDTTCNVSPAEVEAGIRSSTPAQSYTRLCRKT